MPRYGTGAHKRFLDWFKKIKGQVEIVGWKWKDQSTLKDLITGGWPDLVLKLPNGKIEFYEVKSEGQPLQDNQKEILQLLKDMGGSVYVATENKETGEFDVVKFCKKEIDMSQHASP